jgi:hypothetical protein
MSYDDPNQYAHTDRNEYDRELDARDRDFEKEPIRLQGLGERPFPDDNDPED